MVKNFLYISPQFPPNYIAFSQRLKRFGIRVFGIASDWFGALPAELQTALAEYYRVDDMNSYEQMLKAGRYFKDKYGSVDRIESHTEYWLPVEAALRDELDVWGKRRADMPAIRRKSRMKEIFRAAGIPVARGCLYDSPEAARAFAAECGYPVIAKPDEGVGAAATYNLKDKAALDSFLTLEHNAAYFLEEYVDGEILTFDGLTNHEGQIVYCNSLRYSTGIMDVVNNDDLVYYYTARDISSDLEKLGHRTVQAFGVQEKFFHFEFFRRKKDGAFLGLEVNIRPPGGMTTDMWNYADDIDLYEEWARIVAHNHIAVNWERKYHVLYASRKHRFRYVFSHQQILEKYSSFICAHQPMPDLFAGALGNYSYILRAASLEPLLEAADMIQKRHPA
ncbi:MAG TPA: ATP-grasp domain-containing protein [Oligoflexia bacterium]|nr:ATP-grasp domain-containing protein [Oligoflexia bacterium]